MSAAFWLSLTGWRREDLAHQFQACEVNRIFQSLIALLAGWNVPFLCTETHDLGEEAVASYLYQVHLYHWLETNDSGRFLADRDL